MPINYDIQYEHTLIENEDVPCFGDLADEYERDCDWGGLESDDEEVQYITYYLDNPIPEKVQVWIKRHPLFGPPVMSISDDSISVSADYPGNQIMLTLSMARLFGSYDKEEYVQYFDDILELTGDLSMSIYLCDFQDDMGRCLKYREESCSAPFTIAEFIRFLDKPLFPRKERSYRVERTYGLFKEWIYGAGFHEYCDYIDEKITQPQLLEILKYEKAF